MTDVGRVQNVVVNTDDNKIYVDVSISPNRHWDKLEFRSPATGVWFVPEEGDIVEVDTVGKGRRIAHSPHNTPGVNLPDGLSEGDISFRLNEGTLLHFKQTDSGYDIKLVCDGDMYLDAGNVFVGDTDNAMQVATANHTHDVMLSTGDSTTTDTENEDPTETQIE